MSAAEAPPLEALCLLGLSDIGSDKDECRGAGRWTLVWKGSALGRGEMGERVGQSGQVGVVQQDKMWSGLVGPG